MLPTVSLCMIVRNESAHIRLALESACPFVDEIVIVDTGSTDTTAEICRAYTENIHHMRWGDDFSAARNEALKYATKDWVLMLDADELLDQRSGQNLKQILAALPVADTVFSVLIYDIPATRPEQFITQPELLNEKQHPAHQHTRLLRNHCGIRYKYALHEMLDYERNKLRRSDIRLLHYGYHVADKSRFPRAMACLQHDLERYPQDPYVLFNYARTLALAERYDEAYAAYENAIRQYLLAKAERTHIHLSMLFAYYGELLFVRKDYQRAEKLVFQWLTRLGDNFDIRPHILLAKIKYMAGDSVGARRLLTLLEPRLQDLPQAYKNLFAEDIPRMCADVYYFLGALTLEAGEPVKALSYIDMALEYRPEMPSLQALREIALSKV